MAARSAFASRRPVNDVVADVSTLSWVNMLLGTIWPKANTALINYVHDELTPRLRDVLPAPFKRLRFARISLGQNVPQFGPIEVRRHSDSHVQLELDMRYFSDVDVLVETGTAGISFGINQMTIVGRLSLALKPLLQTSPIIGGVHLFFAKQPRVELKFSGLAQAVNEVPGLQSKFQGAVDDFFRNAMVLPNMKTFHLTSDDKLMDLTAAASHPPLGVLRVRVQRARNLAGANLQVGLVERFTSDPYCVLRLGRSSMRTSTVKGSTDPVWPDDEPSSYFVVYHDEQELDINVRQEDNSFFLIRRNLVSNLGKLPSTTVRSLLQCAETTDDGRLVAGFRINLDTSQVNGHLLHVDDPVNTGVASELEFNMEWCDLGDPLSEKQRRAPPRCKSFSEPVREDPENASVQVVLLELHRGFGFPEEFAMSRKGFRWRIRLEEQDPAFSKRGEWYFEEPNYDLNLHPRLFSVIDNLTEFNQTVAEIADICDTEPQVISAYLQARREWQEKMDHRQREAGEERCVEVRWHETMALIVRKPRESNLALDLIEGEDRVVGHLDPIPLQHVLHEGGSLPRTTFKLTPALQSTAKRESGILSSVFFPSCNKPVLANPHRYRAVRMELSLRMHSLLPGKRPREELPAVMPTPSLPPPQHLPRSVVATERQRVVPDLPGAPWAVALAQNGSGMPVASARPYLPPSTCTESIPSPSAGLYAEGSTKPMLISREALASGLPPGASKAALEFDQPSLLPLSHRARFSEAARGDNWPPHQVDESPPYAQF